MTKIIIGLTGQIASGKGVAKQYLETKYQAKDCRFSTPLRDTLARFALPIDRSSLQTLSTILRQTFGEDLLARAIANDAKNLMSDLVIVDGVRRLADIKYLTELPNFFLVAIEAPAQTRYERMVKRNENVGDAQKSYEDFLADQAAEADREIPTVMTQAKFKINNDGQLEDFYRQLDEIINQTKN